MVRDAFGPGRIQLLALARAPFMSAREKILLADMLDACGGAGGGLASLSASDAEAVLGRSLRGASWDARAWIEAAGRDLRYFEKAQVRAVAYWDADYPPVLRETARPPFMLYVRGRLPEAAAPSLAVVGTRFPTGRALEAAAGLAAQAARAGIAVVSGLARGVDSCAHRGSLAGGGPTFAVLGRGVDEVYPRANRELAARIVASGGGLLSEYPPGVPPSRWTFPERNRIIAGLCRSTVVVEAPEGSGALITASFALEEGRDVYAAAACRGGPRSAGSDALVADGARAVSSIEDILRDWGYPQVSTNYVQQKPRRCTTWPATRQ